MISKADKINSVIILYQDEYYQKVEDFISNNNFNMVESDITKKLQRTVRSTVNECQTIHKDERWKYLNLNPAAPTMRGLIKLHKENTPVRPVLNCRNAPGYKLAKKMVKILNSYIPLPFTYNIKNTVQLMNELTDIPYDPNTKFASYAISSMYSNIPTHDLIVTLKKLCKSYNLDNRTTRDIITVIQTITEQNYFRFRDKFYMQKEGRAMGAPTSSILSEVYLQYKENTKIYDLLIKHKIIGYFRYVDDILLMYKEESTNIYKMLDDYNNLAPTLKFTIE
jgi:hypothetical protein